MNTKRTILVIVGRAVSGKDTIGAYLESNYRFTQVVTGQLLRDYITENKLGGLDRDVLIRVANEVRATKGVDFFVKKALQASTNFLVINGLRAVGEISAAREAGGIVIAVDAPIESRYRWATGRGRDSDRISFDDFTRQEKLESANKSASAQSIDEIVASADHTIHNDGSLPELFAKVDALMADLGLEKV